MEFHIAENAGFCFGVRRAVECAFKVCEEATGGAERRIYTLGKLIHNRETIGQLEKLGAAVISENDLGVIFLSSGDFECTTVITRAHGVRRELSEKLENFAALQPKFRVCDCTCPFVKKIHRIVSDNSQGRITLIIGDKSHPEVEGIKSYARGEAVVCNTADDVEKCADKFVHNALIMVAQTTQNLAEYEKCQKIIQKVCTNALIFDTICNVTESRQVEINTLSQNVDLMLVIGDPDSSNTNKLYDISKHNLPDTLFIQGPDDIKLGLIPVTPHLKVGIAAGASTPSGIIEEVIKTMSQIEQDAIRNDDTDNGAASAENSKAAENAGKKGESENFADMLEKSLKTLNTGETVKGIITSITPAEIHVDLEAKVTGIIPSTELTDNPGVKIEELYKVGDEIEAIVVKVSDLDGVATLSRKRIDNIINWRKIVDAFNQGTVLEGKITEVVKSGVIIAINSVRIFVPASQSGLPKDADLATLVGTTQRVKIIDLNEQRRRAVASIRAVVREERKAREDEFWNSIEKDKKYEGVVKSLTSYGAFVDLGGVDGMVHSSELSWKRIRHPSDVVSVGDTISVYVKDFDRDAKRISLGYKTEAMNPWNIFTSKYQIGDVASVKIVSMMPFGAFAEIVPGTDGLIHISQIADRKINQPSDVLEIGQVVDVKIIDIDMENQKISLSIRALLRDKEENGETAEADDDSDK